MLENSGCRFITDISNTIYELTEDERIREQCRLRDERIGEENWFKGLKGRLAKAEAELKEKDALLTNQAKIVKTTKTELKAAKTQLSEKDKLLKTTRIELKEKDKMLNEQNSIIADLKAELAELKG